MLYYIYNKGNVVELVDTTDLKSVAVKGVRVQVPPFSSSNQSIY